MSRNTAPGYYSLGTPIRLPMNTRSCWRWTSFSRTSETNHTTSSYYLKVLELLNRVSAGFCTGGVWSEELQGATAAGPTLTEWATLPPYTLYSALPTSYI